MKHPNHLWIAVLAMIAGLTHEPSLAAQSQARVVQVCAVNDAAVPPALLRRAEAQASRLFAMIGVSVSWAQQVFDRQPCRIVRITNHEGADPRIVPAALGVAPSAEWTASKQVYVFYPRVVRLSRAHNVMLDNVLAAVIAHELAHTLLPIGWHSKAGLMQGEWESAHLRLADQGMLVFTKNAATLIRAHTDR